MKRNLINRNIWKILGIFFLIGFSSSKCYSQINIPIENLFLKKFIADYKNDLRYFKENKLYISVNFAEYKDYSENGINVIFLNPKEIKEMVTKIGKFNLIEMSNFTISGKFIKTEFNFLIALNEKDADFAESHNTQVNYCLKFNCDNNEYEIFSCD